MILEDPEMFECSSNDTTHSILREGSTRWGSMGMSELVEDSEDVEAGYISSDESGHAADLGERLRPQASRDVWELDDIQYSLRHLPFAEEISTLIEAGRYDEVVSLAQSSEREIGSRTAALWASYMGRSSLLSKLLSSGVNPNAADDSGRTCLHLSCLVGCEECVKQLLQHGANPNQWDSSQEKKATPLHCAASARSLACVEVLISHGADVNAGLDDRTPLHYAVLSDAAEVVKTLLDASACPDTSQVFTETPLHVAASLGLPTCTKLLLDAGADVRAAMGTRKATALHLAAEDGHAECASLLLDHGANIDCLNYKGQTPLHLAALAQSVEVVELFVGKSANVNARDVNGRTPLHGSIVKGARACDVARQLLSVGADPNAPDNFGYTPLHIAALNEFSACVLLLLDYGGDVTLRTNGGVSVLSFIVRRVPDVIPRYVQKFDDAVHISEHELGDVDCELTVDFRPLVPSITRGEAELLLAFIEVGHKDILKHPVAESFLFLKWRRIRKFFVLSFIYHAVFISLFSFTILSIFLCRDNTCEVKPYIMPIQLMILLLNVCFFIKETFQYLLDWSAYIRQWENWLQILIILGVFLCTIPKEIADEKCSTELRINMSNLDRAGIKYNYSLPNDLVTETPNPDHTTYNTYDKTTDEETTEAFPNYAVHVAETAYGQDTSVNGDSINIDSYEPAYVNETDINMTSYNHKVAATCMKTAGWQHDVATLTIFIAWLELMMILGRFPTFGLYVQMFTTVTMNFSKFLLAYSCLMVAFGLAFSILFSNYPAFHMPQVFVKTVMMMSGELEYEDLFYNNTKDHPIQYPVTAYFMFLIFVLLVTVILTNLLVGLAVSDIQALQESAGLDRLVRTTQLVGHLESMLFSPLLGCAPKKLVDALRWEALLTVNHTRSLNIRPNDPRENRLPKDLVASIYKMVCSRKDTKRSIRKNNNYELRLKCKGEDVQKHVPLVKRKSNLYDRYSSESQQVERRKRNTSTNNRPVSFSVNAIQEICMVDIKSQLTDLTKKINKLIETTDTRLNSIETRLNVVQTT